MFFGVVLTFVLGLVLVVGAGVVVMVCSHALPVNPDEQTHE